MTVSAGAASEKVRGARQFVLLVEEHFDLLDLAGPLQVIATVNRLRDTYQAVTASPFGGPVTSSAGLQIVTEPLPAVGDGGIDTILVIGGAQNDGEQRRAMVDWLTRKAGSVRRVCGIGLGLDALARSALVSRADSAVHWRRADPGGADPRRCPIVRRHGSIWTCVGGSAAIDLSLSLVAEDLGRPTALSVAELLVMFTWRHPDEAQVSDMLAMQIRGGAPFARLIDRMRGNLAADLRVETLAEWCNMTPRTFARRFARETGTTPAAATAAIRLEAAEIMLRAGGLSRKQVAARCGFGSELSLRRALQRSGSRR